MSDKALRLAHWLTVATETIGALLMLSIVVINFLQVFFRYVVVDPLGWTEEVMRYSVVWLTFLLAGAVLMRGEHMIVDVLGGHLPAGLRRVQNVAILLCICAFCAVLVWYGLPQAIRNAQQSSPVAQIPMVIPYFSVVVGAVLTFAKAVCLMLADPERLHGTTDIPGGEEPTQ